MKWRVVAGRGAWPVFALLVLVTQLSGQTAAPVPAFLVPGKITGMGVVRAQAVVDSVFLDRLAPEGFVEGGDWASYLMARLGVEPLPENTAIAIRVDSNGVEFSGRLQDLPEEARAMLGPLAALVDSSTVLTALLVQLPAARGLVHYRLERIVVGRFPIPETMLRYMMFDVGDRYPALTRSGRDLFVQIPVDGRVTLVPGAIRLRIVPETPGS